MAAERRAGGEVSYRNGGGGVPVVYLLAHADAPLTAREIADRQEVSVSTVRSTLRRLWHAGFVVRRIRHDGSEGTPPFEYAVSPLDVRRAVVEEVHGDE